MPRVPPAVRRAPPTRDIVAAAGEARALAGKHKARRVVIDMPDLGRDLLLRVEWQDDPATGRRVRVSGAPLEDLRPGTALHLLYDGSLEGLEAASRRRPE